MVCKVEMQRGKEFMVGNFKGKGVEVAFGDLVSGGKRTE